MIARTRGIVLKCVGFRDNKSIAHILTEEFGKISYLVYAPQSKKARIRQYNLQPLTVLELDVEHIPQRELQQIKEAHPVSLNSTLLTDPAKMAICFFMAEVIDKSTGAIEKDTSLFRFLLDYISMLDGDKVTFMFPVTFMLDYSMQLGIYPDDRFENDFIKSEVGKDDQQLLVRLLDGDRKFTNMEQSRLLHRLVEYYRHHLPGMGNIVSLDIVETLFDNQ